MHQPLRDSQLKVLWTSRVDYVPNSGVPPHSHSAFYQLLFMLDGDGFLIGPHTKIKMQRGHYYFIHQNTVHGYEFSDNAATLDFKFKIMEPALEAWMLTMGATGRVHEEQKASLFRIYKLSMQFNAQPESIKTLEVDSGFKSTLISLLANDTVAASRMEISDHPIAMYIYENHKDDLSLDKLAQIFKYHPHYLVNLFKTRTGKTPIQYLQHVRLDKSKEYLEFTDMNISDIASEIGLCPHYFSKLFFRKEGVSPSDYRDQMKRAAGKDIVLDPSFCNDWNIVKY